MKKLQLYFFVLMAALVCSSAAFAQELVISGKIVSDEKAEPLPGAEIQVKGTYLGTVADVEGKFELKLADMADATLVVSYVGYKTVEVHFHSSTRDVVVRLPEDILKGSEVVVTGLATSVKRQNLANSVGTISEKELLPVTTQTIERALEGKFAGISVTQNTGAPGGGIDVNLRGTSTIEGSTQPLYVVDGVIVNNTATQSGIDLVSKAPSAGNPSPQGQPVNRIADINPNDIESIEVLKGASAAAIYGSKATNGVVIITTKRGTPGRTRIDISQKSGFNSILSKIGTRKFPDTSAVAEKYGSDGVQIFQQNPGRYIDYEDVVYGEKGFISETTVSARGGSEKTQFYVSGLARDENGIVKNTGYQKFSGRLNLDHQLSERADLSVSANYVRSEADRLITGNDNSGTTLGISLAFTPSFYDIRPINGTYPDHIFNSSNPIQTRDLLTNNELVNRYIVSSRLRFNILRGERHALDFVAQGGVDFYSQEDKIISPSELQYEKNSDLPGTSILGETENTNSNLYLNLIHRKSTASNLTFTTSAGVQFENADLNNVLSEARGVTPTQTNIDQAAAINAFQEKTIQRERGFFFQEEVEIQEKLFLTGGLRGDASSANSETDKYFFYPKFAASLRLSQFSFWKNDFFPEFKIRGAYGETGNLAPPNAKFLSFIPSNIGGQGGVLPASLRGNPDIKPERTKEREVGIDALLFRGNASLEFTYFSQKISDLILIQSLPPSSGFTQEILNGGEMTTRGLEISLGITPFRRSNFDWTSRINFYTTQSEIDKLTVDPFNKGGFATSLGTYRIEEGLSPTSIIGPDTTASGERIILGDATPDFQISFNNILNFNLGFGNFELSFLWDWRKGGDVINLGKLLMDLGGTSPDYDDPATNESLNLPSNGVVDAADCSDDRLGACRLELLGRTAAPYVEDGSFLKLRELSLTYDVPLTTTRGLFGARLSYLRIGVSGRNLLMFTGYDGYDPEVSQFGNVAIDRAIDVVPFPSARSFYFNVSFGL